jgi:hypothetical protein
MSMKMLMEEKAANNLWSRLAPCAPSQGRTSYAFRKGSANEESDEGKT